MIVSDNCIERFYVVADDGTEHGAFLEYSQALQFGIESITTLVRFQIIKRFEWSIPLA